MLKDFVRAELPEEEELKAKMDAVANQGKAK